MQQQLRRELSVAGRIVPNRQVDNGLRVNVAIQHADALPASFDLNATVTAGFGKPVVKRAVEPESLKKVAKQVVDPLVYAIVADVTVAEANNPAIEPYRVRVACAQQLAGYSVSNDDPEDCVRATAMMIAQTVRAN
jgi:hypothetical protein